MTTTLHLPGDLAARLDAEATRRGTDAVTLSAEMLTRCLAEADDLRAFIGSGHSGRGDLAQRHREIAAAARADLRARDL